MTLLTVPEALAAAGRIVQRADAALTLRRALDGVPDRELLSIVILARQLDGICRTAAALDVPIRLLCSPRRLPAREWNPAAAVLVQSLIELLTAAGYLPLPPSTEPAKEPAHGEG